MNTWWHQNKDGSLNLEKVSEVLMRHIPRGSDAHFGLDMIMQRIAELENEKKTNDTKEIIAWQIKLSDSSPWMTINGSTEAGIDWFTQFEQPFMKRPLYAGNTIRKGV